MIPGVQKTQRPRPSSVTAPTSSSSSWVQLALLALLQEDLHHHAPIDNHSAHMDPSFFTSSCLSITMDLTRGTGSFAANLREVSLPEPCALSKAGLCATRRWTATRCCWRPRSRARSGRGRRASRRWGAEAGGRGGVHHRGFRGSMAPGPLSWVTLLVDLNIEHLQLVVHEPGVCSWATQKPSPHQLVPIQGLIVSCCLPACCTQHPFGERSLKTCSPSLSGDPAVP